MVQFTFFRIHVYQGPQKPLPYGDGEGGRPRVLGEIFQNLLTVKRKSGGFWHIANCEPITDTAYYMKIGRTVERLREVFLTDKAEFRRISSPEAETAHVFLDIPSELLVISENPHLGGANSTAKWFITLLKASPKFVEFEAELEVSPITDPRGLIQHVHSAHTVTTVWVELPRKNAHNNQDYLFGPIQAKTEDFNGKLARLRIIGEKIQATDDLDALFQEASAIGGVAGASFRREEDSRIQSMTTKDTVLKAQTPDIPDDAPRTKLQELLKRLQGNADAARRGQSG